MMKHQQQQRIVIVGAILLVTSASCWIWYKSKSKGKQRRRRRGRGGDNYSSGSEMQQLLLDDDFDVTPEELQQLFDEAAKVARAFPKGMLDQRDQLMMYGLYKQAQHGDAADGVIPSKLNVVAHAKYVAWKKFIGLPKQFAMRKYCEVVYHFAKGGASSFQEGTDENADVVYHDDDRDECDVDEDGCPIEDEYNNNSPESYSGMMGIRQSTLSNNVSNKLFQYFDDESGSSPEVRLRNAALSSDKVRLESAIHDGANLDDPDESGQTALHFAADKGCMDCLCMLLSAGANINAYDQDGISVLQTAVSAGIDVEGVRVLLEAGADPDAQDVDGDSPRSIVLEEGKDELVDLFALYT